MKLCLYWLDFYFSWTPCKIPWIFLHVSLADIFFYTYLKYESFLRPLWYLSLYNEKPTLSHALLLNLSNFSQSCNPSIITFPWILFKVVKVKSYHLQTKLTSIYDEHFNLWYGVTYILVTSRAALGTNITSNNIAK